MKGERTRREEKQDVKTNKDERKKRKKMSRLHMNKTKETEVKMTC